jgi:hypothetical protein
MDSKKMAIAALKLLDPTLKFKDWQNGLGEEIGDQMRAVVTALKADIAKPVEQHGWLIDGSLLYRLNEHGSNCDEINVNMANGSRTPEIRAFVAAALLTRITTPQEPAAIPAGWMLVPIEPTDAMLSAFNTAVNTWCKEFGDDADVYKAILAAAPAK